MDVCVSLFVGSVFVVVLFFFQVPLVVVCERGFVVFGIFQRCGVIFGGVCA